MSKQNKEDNFDVPLIEKYEDGIYYLGKMYERIVRILDTVLLADNIIPNKALNAFYMGFLEGVESILDKEQYNELKKDFPEHPDNVLNLSDEIRVWWEEELKSKALNFVAQLEKHVLRIGDHKVSGSSFDEVIRGVDIAIQHHVKYDETLMKKLNEGLTKKEEFIKYEYEDKIGTLKIKNNEPIKFERVTAIVLNFFSIHSELDNSYKNYRHFEKREERLIGSSEFSKKIKAINERICKETNGQVKSVICMARKEKPNETNKYKWKLEV